MLTGKCTEKHFLVTGEHMEFKREQYVDTLIRKQCNHLIKTVTRMRRVGKSYLIFTLFKRHLLSQGVKPSHIIEMSFDTFENLRFRNPHEFYPYVKGLIKDGGMHLYCWMKSNSLMSSSRS